MTLIETFGQLLKYETHRLFHKDAAVMVVCTPEEWAAFQEAAKHPDAPVELAAVATVAAGRANVVPQAGKLSVQFAAGDYHALGEAHEAVSDAPAPAEKPKDESEKKDEPDKLA
jgi:hypothetical protein